MPTELAGFTPEFSSFDFKPHVIKTGAMAAVRPICVMSGTLTFELETSQSSSLCVKAYFTAAHYSNSETNGNSNWGFPKFKNRIPLCNIIKVVE
jgi:hypothetical protein